MPNLGWVSPQDRTQQQQDAHEAAVKKMPRFSLPPAQTAGPVLVNLFDFVNKPSVVAETGITFDRTPFRQLTGSCVGAGGGNALMILIAVQRMLSSGATKAFIPFWGFNYGRSRLLMGDRNQGEGSMGSTFFESVVKEGIIANSEAGLPPYGTSDGLALTENQEYSWSDGDSRPCVDYLDEAAPHPLGAAGQINDVSQIKTAIINGYPCTFACNNFIGDASVRGSGDKARVMGRWSGHGGHQQFVFAYEDHPDYGPIYGVGNNWGRNTYPKDLILPLCSNWVTEADVASAMRLDSEVFPLSHLKWFELQPEVLDWVM